MYHCRNLEFYPLRLFSVIVLVDAPQTPDIVEETADSEDESQELARGSLLEYVHLEYLPNRNGVWVTKKVEDALEGDDDEWKGYSFVLLKNWEWDRKHSSIHFLCKWLINCVQEQATRIGSRLRAILSVMSST
jgi:hypothetical protein